MLILDHYLSLEGLDGCRFMFFPFICTHTDIHAQHCLPLLLLYCVPGRLASGLSLGPGAGGSRQGEGGWLHLLGDLLQGPRSGLAQFSCLSSKAQPCGEKQREDSTSAVALPLLVSHVPSVNTQYVDDGACQLWAAFHFSIYLWHVYFNCGMIIIHTLQMIHFGFTVINFKTHFCSIWEVVHLRNIN